MKSLRRSALLPTTGLTTGTATTSVLMTVDNFNASQNIRITVTTLTGFVWTADSLRTGALAC
jgi:hypothetical protein